MRARDTGIVGRPRFTFANKPGRGQGQVAAKLANDLSPVMATKRPNDPIEPMTLANMHHNGVRYVWVQC
jgi:hypothetical protein